MKKILDLLNDTVSQAFEAAGYDASLGHVSVSNRPDLCQYQCNGALAGAKKYHKAPIAIAEETAEHLKDNPIFAEVDAVKPGFLNFNLSGEFLAGYAQEMLQDEDRYGYEKDPNPGMIIIDYGGPNVAKPLHVGHLRSAIIGESVKRIKRFAGNEVLGDVHLGDWGLQMGLIITELHERKPDLVYFDPDYTGDYPKEAPFTISELEEIYPAASAKSKEDEAYHKKALEATNELQHGRRGYQALLKHILNVSVTDLKRNYARLNVHFDLWNGESDAQPYIPDMVQKLKDEGYAYVSDGALVVDVAEDTDTKEVPPCMILKSDGASLYTTTDLATLVMREEKYQPSEVLYVVDKRQEMHFIQCFRCAKKTGIVPKSTKLTFLGFGTMNGKDGKPFKTREGGVMRLETLLDDVYDKMLEKISADGMTEEEKEQTARTVALAALKYGDLSNQASKDYVFDIDRFTSSEGNTGPYILYTIVRIKSILKKYQAKGKDASDAAILPAASTEETALVLELARYNDAMAAAYAEDAPHKICAYIFGLANAFNAFYHENRILSCEDEDRQKSWIRLLDLTKGVLERCIDLLGFEAPEKM